MPPLRAAPAPLVEAVDVLELGRDDEPAVLGGNAPAAVLLHGEETEVDREEVPVPGREKQVAVEVVEGVPAVLAVGPKDIAPFPFLAPDEFEARLQDERAVGADDAHARLGRGLGAAFLEFARAKVAEGQRLGAVWTEIARAVALADRRDALGEGPGERELRRHRPRAVGTEVAPALRGDGSRKENRGVRRRSRAVHCGREREVAGCGVT